MSTPTRLTEEPILKAGESLTKDKLVNFIKNKEGFSNVAYKDGSQYSIGYGTRALNPKETISEKEAEQRFLEDLNNRENFIRGFSEKHGYNWDDQQIYSLTDFHYNVGDTTYHFMDTKKQTLNNISQVKVIDKGFVSDKEYKKYLKLASTYPCYKAGKMENIKVLYHIKVI